MIIDITKSKLFVIEPDLRFSKEFNLDRGVWTDLWRKHIFNGYTQKEMREYLMFKTKRNPSEASICRWIIRTRIYSITSPILKKGVVHVNSQIFGEYEDYVIKEITKHMRSGASINPKTII